MAINYHVLGQSNPTGGTLTAAYTVPAATQTIVSTIAICNQAATATTFTIAVQVNGASLSASQYVNYQTPLPGNDTVTLTIGMTLNAGDVISVQTPSTTVSFNIFGSEIS